MRIAPAAENLPAGWGLSGWLGSIHTASGSGGTENTHATGGKSRYDGWSWSSSGVQQLEAGAFIDSGGQAAQSLACSGLGFDPASRQAGQQIATALALCAGADFPGADPATAGAWVAKQEPLLLAALKAHGPGYLVRSSSPRFGTGVYWLEAFYSQGYGYSIQLTVM